MVNQHAKWLEKCKTEVKWRASIPSLNLLVTSTVWRQDHNGFTHQDPVSSMSSRTRARSSPASISARRELSAERGRSLSTKRRLRERHRRGQAAPSPISGYRRGGQALRKKASASGRGPARIKIPNPMSSSRARAMWSRGSAGRNRPLREKFLHLKSGSSTWSICSASTVDGASGRTDRPRLRFAVHERKPAVSRSTATRRSFTSSRTAVPTTKHARPWLQEERQQTRLWGLTILNQVIASAWRST